MVTHGNTLGLRESEFLRTQLSIAAFMDARQTDLWQMHVLLPISIWKEEASICKGSAYSMIPQNVECYKKEREGESTYRCSGRLGQGKSR